MHLHNQLFNSQDVDLSDEKLEIVKKKQKWNLHKNYLIAKNWNMKTTNKNNVLFFVNNKKK